MYLYNKNFMIFGNYIKFKVCQLIIEVCFCVVFDEVGGFYGDYCFIEGVLKNFGFSVGVDYKSDVVGENIIGYMIMCLLFGGGFVVVQLSFKVVGCIFVNIGVIYCVIDWIVCLQVNNVMDKDYIFVVGSCGLFIVGELINVKVLIIYNF